MKFVVMLTICFFANVSFAQTATEVRRIMSPSSTLYQILNIPATATDSEIRAAYRTLMKAYHPDRYQNDPVKLKAATEITQKLNTTRDTLLDPIQRLKYDATIKPKTSSFWADRTYTAEEEVKPKPQPKPQAKATPTPTPTPTPAPSAEPRREEAKPKAQSASETRSSSTTDAKPSTADSYKADTVKPAAQQTKAASPEMAETYKKAHKMYQDVQKCGEGFFKTFVDVMI